MVDRVADSVCSVVSYYPVAKIDVSPLAAGYLCGRKCVRCKLLADGLADIKEAV